MKKIKAIIFNIGGVLAFENRENKYNELSLKFGFDLDEFETIRKEKVQEFAKGLLTEDEYLDFFSKRFNLNLDEFKREWIRASKNNYSLNKELATLIKKLRTNYLLGTLTNIIPLHNKEREESGIYNLFQFNLLSFEQKMIKPNKEFYNLIFEKTALKPEEILFIDDYEPYLKPAKELGMKIILFTNNNNLLKDLKKFNIDIN